MGIGAFFLWSPTGATSAYTLGFDIVTSEMPTFDNQVTEHPVEVGTDVADHVRVGLNKVTLEVFVTNEPIDPATQWSRLPGVQTPSPQFLPGPNQPPKLPQVLTAKEWFTLPIGVPLFNAITAHEIDVPFGPDVGLDPTIGQVAQIQTLQFPTNFDAVQLTHDVLKLLRDTAQIMTVFGSKGTYDNMVIENFSMTRNADTGTGGTFTLALKEIRQVSTTTVAAPKPSVPRAQKRQGKGNQNGTAHTTSTPRSVLKKMVGWF